MAIQDISPKHFKIISAKDKILIFDMESDPSFGLGAQVGGLGGRSAKTVTDAINKEGNLVTDLVNARLDTSAKTILGSFTFGESGAITIQTNEDNGLWLSPTGMLAKKSGANTLVVTTGGDVTMVGTITASAGAIGGWNINTTSIYTGTEDHSGYTANAGDLTIYSNGLDASIHAKNFYIDTTGAFYAVGGSIDGTSTIGGRTASILATAIDANAHFVDDAINTSAKTILRSFTFEESGAIQIGAYQAGVSGDIKISPAGLIGRNKSNENTLALDATTGEITAIKLVGASGLIGGWNISPTALYYDGATNNVSAGMSSADYPFYAGRKYDDRVNAPFRVSANGSVLASSITATGTINAQAGYLSAGVYIDTVNGILCESAGLNVGVAGHIRGGQTIYNTGIGFWLGYDTDAYKFSIGNPSGDYLTYDGATLTVNASSIIKRFTAGMPINAGKAVFIHTDGEIYSTNAAKASMVTTFLGFCLATTAENSLAPVQTFGVITGLSGLTTASVYYLKNCSETQDQVQNAHTTEIVIQFDSEDRYQSFTTGAAVTQISSITTTLYTTIDPGYNATLTLRIRAGEGLGGALLATASTTIYLTRFIDQEVNFLLTVPITVSPSTQYSITLEGGGLGGGNAAKWNNSNANPYANGRNDQSATDDYMFKTYYSTDRGAIQAGAGTVEKKVGIATSATTLTLKDSI